MKSHAVFHSRNFYLLIALFVYFTLSPFIIEPHFSHLLITILMALIVLICINISAYSKSSVIISTTLAIITFIEFAIIQIHGHTQGLFLLYFTTNSIFLFYVTITLIYSVAKHSRISIDTLLGAICGYLLIGLTWSHLFLIASCLDPTSFTYQLSEGEFRDNVQHFIYFSYITLTTVGYGDITPRTDITRALCWIEAAIGQVYLTVWISQLVALHIAQRIRENLR